MTDNIAGKVREILLERENNGEESIKPFIIADNIYLLKTIIEKAPQGYEGYEKKVGFDNLNKGIQSLEEEKYITAEEYFNKSIETTKTPRFQEFPAHNVLIVAQALLGLSMINRHNNELGKATRRISRAYHRYPAKEYLLIKGDLFLERGRNMKAQIAYIKAIQKNPENAHAYNGVGVLQSRMNTYTSKKQAMHLFEEALKYEPENKIFQRNKEICLSKIEND